MDEAGHVIVAWPRRVWRAGCEQTNGCSVLLEARASRDSASYCPAEQLFELPIGKSSSAAFQELGELHPLTTSPDGEAFFLLQNDLRRRGVGLGGPCLPPVNRFSFAGRELNQRKGSADLSIDVPGPGRLSAAGHGMKPHGVAVPGIGFAHILVRPTGSVARELNYTGRAGVRAVVKFKPTGGRESTQVIRVKLKKSP